MTSRDTGAAAKIGGKPPVKLQGKAIVERGDGELLVMFPDGSIVVASDASEAARKIARWFREHMNVKAINVGMIEWRDGIQPSDDLRTRPPPNHVDVPVCRTCGDPAELTDFGYCPECDTNGADR